MERGIVADLLRLAPEHFPDAAPSVVSLEQDPPDCLVVAGGARYGVEVTELVDRHFLEAVVRAKRAGTIVYDWADWSRDKFLECVNERVHAKSSPNEVFEGPFDDYVLLIHTAEPGLTPELAQSWLEHHPPPASGIIGRAFLLFDYRPDDDRLVVEVPLNPGGGDA